MIRAIAENRNLLKNLVVRDLQQRYVGSVGGFLWSVVNPLIQLLIFWFAYSVVFRQAPGPDSAGVSTPLFLFSGLLPWFLFSDTVLRNCTAVADRAALVTKTVIPPEILPVAATLSNLVHHAIGLGILIGWLAVSRGVPMSALGLFFYLPVLLLFAQGLGWLAAGMQVFVRDTIHAVQLALSAWYWLTPVVYGIEKLGGLQSIAMINPLATLVTGYRNSLLGLTQPDALHVVLTLGSSAAVFAAGAAMFKQTKAAFADVL